MRTFKLPTRTSAPTMPVAEMWGSAYKTVREAVGTTGAAEEAAADADPLATTMTRSPRSLPTKRPSPKGA